MFEDSYNEYIRSILGYQQPQMDTCVNTNYDYMPTMTQSTYNSELEDCYPEIYKLVYPMVTKACNSNIEPLSRDLVDRMTNDIYFSLESNNEVNININLNNEVKKTQTTKSENRAEVKTKEVKEDRAARPMNNGLRDIIKILLLRELLGRPQFPGRPPVRPPFPGGPGPVRPPYPGGPGPVRPPYPGNPRPPIMPRIYEENYDDLYER